MCTYQQEYVMTYAEFRKLVKAHKGWIDGEHARFPTPAHLAAFERALETAGK
jgi:hypothetical protein